MTAEYEPTAEQRAIVESASAFGIPQAEIANHEQEAILAGLSESEAEALQYDWSFYARPHQLLPAGNWLTWLLLDALAL